MSCKIFILWLIKESNLARRFDFQCNKNSHHIIMLEERELPKPIEGFEDFDPEVQELVHSSNLKKFYEILAKCSISASPEEAYYEDLSRHVVNITLKEADVYIDNPVVITSNNTVGETIEKQKQEFEDIFEYYKTIKVTQSATVDSHPRVDGAIDPARTMTRVLYKDGETIKKTLAFIYDHDVLCGISDDYRIPSIMHEVNCDSEVSFVPLKTTHSEYPKLWADESFFILDEDHRNVYYTV